MKMGGSSPKSWISEPMNERDKISMKQENEEDKQTHNLNVNEPENYRNKRRLTKSRTGIDPKPYINIVKEK